MLEHDTETTLTMLEKKAAELRGKVVKAGWAAIEEHSLHNETALAPGANEKPMPAKEQP